MNTWDTELANCSVPTDNWDPDRENILTNTGSAVVVKSADFKVGTWRRVFCLTNRVYHPALIKQKRVFKKDKSRFMIHFELKGNPLKKNEWVEGDSERIIALDGYGFQDDEVVVERSASDKSFVRALKKNAAKTTTTSKKSKK